MVTREQISIKDSFVTIFSPIYIIQTILGSSRVNIRENDVTTVTVGQKLYSAMWIVAVTFSVCYFETFFYKVFYNHNTTLFCTSSAAIIIQYIAYIANIIHARFWCAESYVKLYFILQKVDRDHRLKGSQYSKDSHYYLNVVMSLVIIVSFGCGYAVYVINTVEYPLLTAFMGIGLLTIYFDVVLTASLIHYITIRLCVMNKVIHYNVFMKYGNFGIKKNRLVIHDNGLNLNNFTLCLKDILKLHKMITEVASFPVLIIAITGFIWTFFAIETMVVGIPLEMVNMLAMVPIGLWVLFYFIKISVLAILNGWFIQEVKKTKVLCINALSYNVEDSPVRKAVKDIIRTIEFSQPEFSVYGIFVLDKMLPLTIIGVITTNVLVLIQFTV